MYARSCELADDGMRVYGQDPSLFNQQAMAAVLDRRHGGWIGARKYRELYQPDCYYCSSEVWPTPPESVTWEAGPRKEWFDTGPYQEV